MEKRPTIKLTLNSFDVIIQFLIWFTLLSIWATTLLNYSALPDVIPTHFDGDGEINGHDAKKGLFDLPVIATVISIGIFFLNKVPQYFNYLVKITSGNAGAEHTRATRMLCILSLLVNITFLIIIIFTLNAADHQKNFGNWVLLLIIGVLTFLPLLVIVNWLKKLKN